MVLSTRSETQALRLHTIIAPIHPASQEAKRSRTYRGPTLVLQWARYAKVLPEAMSQRPRTETRSCWMSPKAGSRQNSLSTHLPLPFLKFNRKGDRSWGSLANAHKWWEIFPRYTQLTRLLMERVRPWTYMGTLFLNRNGACLGGTFLVKDLKLSIF